MLATLSPSVLFQAGDEEAIPIPDADHEFAGFGRGVRNNHDVDNLMRLGLGLENSVNFEGYERRRSCVSLFEDVKTGR